MGPFHLKNQDGADFRKCRHFDNILFELGAVNYRPNFFIGSIFQFYENFLL
jgi:hypothetical protein